MQEGTKKCFIIQDMKAKHYPNFGFAPRTAMWIGIVLIFIGVISRYIIGIRGVNSLTPAFFGVPIAMLGFIAIEPEYARNSMRLITALALLGALFSLHVLPMLNALLLGQPPIGDTAALITSSATLLLCGVLFLICGVAFISVWLKQMRK